MVCPAIIIGDQKAEVSAMWRHNSIKLIGLMLLGVAALIILLPILILSFQVVLLTGLLISAGALGAALFSGARHLHTWLERHHWLAHRHSGLSLRIG